MSNRSSISLGSLIRWVPNAKATISCQLRAARPFMVGWPSGPARNSASSMYSPAVSGTGQTDGLRLR